MLCDQSEFICGCTCPPISRIWPVAVVIRAIFASSTGIRQSKLYCHATCDWRVVDGFLWYVFVSESKQRSAPFGNPGILFGQFIAFTHYLDSFYISKIMSSYFTVESVRIILGTAKLFAKQNSGTFDAPNGLLSCYNWGYALSPETCVVNQPSGIGLGRRY